MGGKRWNESMDESRRFRRVLFAFRGLGIIFIVSYPREVPMGKKKLHLYPKKLHSYIESNQAIPLNLLIEVYGNQKQIKTKKKVVFDCQNCDKNTLLEIVHFTRRVYFKFQPLCPSCYANAYHNDESWRAKNSKAQKLIQGTAEQRKKNSESVKKAHRDNPNIVKRRTESVKKAYRDNPSIRKRLSDIAKERWGDLNTRMKMQTCNPICGTLNGVYFFSSYELLFLLNHDQNKIIENCPFGIPYGEKIYYPDYLVDNKYIVEVKSQYWMKRNEGLNLKKIKAAKQYCIENDFVFSLVYGSDLKKVTKSSLSDVCFIKGEKSFVKHYCRDKIYA